MHIIKRIFFIAVILITFGLINGFAPKSSGSHISSTGAPGEETCNIAYCHDDASVQTGDNVNELLFSGDNYTYIAGNSYTVTVAVSNPGIERFGFQITALDANDNEAGTIQITDTDRTQKQTGNGRVYVTHTSNGTFPDNAGIISWTFEWTAGANLEGPITFYYATQSCNNDNTNSGEQIFLSNQTITPATGIANESNFDHFNAFYHKANNALKGSYNMVNPSKVKVKLYDINGRKIHQWQENAEQGNNNFSAVLPQFLPAGIYVLQIESKSVSKKIKFIVQ